MMEFWLWTLAAAGVAVADVAQALPPTVEHFKPGVKREMALGRPDATWGYLHDNAIYAFKDRLFVAWYNCPKDEMIGDSVIRGRWSDDAGKTWSDIKLFVGSKGAKFMYVPPAFGSDGKDLYLFASRMTGPDVLTDCEIFKWDPKTETFGSVGLMGEKFLPNTAMYRRTDGRVKNSSGLTIIPLWALDCSEVDWKDHKCQALF